MVWLPEERILFTGDLAEERIFPIFPWFPPNDADIDGARWAAILTELIDWKPATVVPGHGDVGGVEILVAVRDYMVDLGKRVGGRAQGREGCRRHRCRTRPEDPGRASRLVVAGVDRLRDPVLSRR